MKIKIPICPAVFTILLCLGLFSCKKEPVKKAPVISVSDVTNITATTATSGGLINDDGGAAITAYGVCWSKNQNPATADSKTTDGSGSGSFTSLLTGLNEGTQYYIRAYATNSVGTGYSNQSTFTTLALAPVLTTTGLSAITSTSATGGGNITSDGGSAVTSRGVCWSTGQNPKTSDNKTTDGTGTGTFTSTITNLTPGTTYYIRAYATNSIGTSYGNELTMTTPAILPVVTTAIVSEITATTATGGGNVTNDGGATVTARGVCWNTSPAPTILNSKTTNGNGTGGFTSSIAGLTPGTIYYVRAYATNSAGTSYGNELTITTPAAIAIEWVAPGAGDIISVYTYSGGFMSGEYRHQKFNVLNASGEITIVIQETALNLAKTVVFNVEKDKQYEMIAKLNYTVQSGTSTSTRCQTFVFSSPDCTTTKEVYINQQMIRNSIFIPPNTTTYYYTYACPGSYSIGDITISPVN